MSRVSAPTTRFTVEEFFRMVDADLFGTTRVELVNGRVYRMASQRSPHMAAISKGSAALQRQCPPSEWIIIQGTLRLDRYSAPDPDLMWVPVAPGTPEHEWPMPLVVIEISDTTYRKDSGTKLRKYAQAGIKDYWIAHLDQQRVEVHRGPHNPTGRLADCRFDSVRHFDRGQSVSLLQRPQVTVAVNDLLP
jgi:Uma2 family endonuclease